MTNTNPSNYDTWIAKAEADCHRLDLDQAVDSYLAAQELQPDNYQVYLGLAKAYSRRRQVPEALGVAEKAIELAPDQAEPHATLGMLHFLTDHPQEALAELTQALELDPTDPETHLTLSQTYADLKRFGDAQQELDTAREQIAVIEDAERRAELEAFAGHAEMYLRLYQGKTNEAMAAGQEVIALEDANPHAASLAYSNLGIIEARARRYDQAIQYLERAYEMNPYFERAGTTLGRLLILQNKADRAAEVLGEIVEGNPAITGSTRYAYAMALEKAGQRVEALDQYRQSAREGLKWPDNVMVRWHLLWLNPVSRYALIGVLLAAVLIWLLVAQPSPQVLTFIALFVVLLTLQRLYNRRRR